MKRLTLASIALVSTLSLTGCSSSTSVEEQTKLIEYEKCLDHYSMVIEKTIDLAIQQKVRDNYSSPIGETGKFQAVLSSCEKYRP